MTGLRATLTGLRATLTGLRATLARIVWRHDTREETAFDVAVTVAILVSLAAYAIETMPTLSPAMRRLVGWVEFSAILFFTVEYGLRVWTAPRPLAYVFSLWGLVDLVAFLPYWLAAGGGFETARLLRLLTLLRMLKFVRYARAFDRLRRALASVREELTIFLVAAAAANFLAAVGIYHFEHDAQPEKFASIPDSLWWSIVTLTTVGYGDVYPVTTGGRVFTALVLLTGLGVIAIPTGLISAALQNARRAELEDERPAAPPRGEAPPRSQEGGAP